MQPRLSPFSPTVGGPTFFFRTQRELEAKINSGFLSQGWADYMLISSVILVHLVTLIPVAAYGLIWPLGWQSL